MSTDPTGGVIGPVDPTPPVDPVPPVDPAPVPPARATDGLRPTVEQVGALIASRGNKPPRAQFDTGSRPTYDQVASIVDQVAADLDTEAGGEPLPDAVASQVTYLLSLLAAATVELALYPEEQQDGAGAVLYARYQTGLTRFRMLLAEEGGGSDNTTGGMQAVGPALGAWQRVNAALARPTPPDWPGPSPTLTYGSGW